MGKDLQEGGKAITNAANDSSTPPKKTVTVHSVNPSTGTEVNATVTAPETQTQ